MILSVIIILAVVLLDQLTKYFSVLCLSGIPTFTVIENVLNFTYVENRGAAFGMLADNRAVFMIISSVGIVALFVWLVVSKPKSAWMRVGISFVIGGGIGNMIDRIGRGFVVDMIDCRFIDFYVFNVADSFVCIGCGMIILALIIEMIVEQKQKSKEKTVGEKNDD